MRRIEFTGGVVSLCCLVVVLSGVAHAQFAPPDGGWDYAYEANEGEGEPGTGGFTALDGWEGITFRTRFRLTPPEDSVDFTGAPDGFTNGFGGKGMFSLVHDASRTGIGDLNGAVVVLQNSGDGFFFEQLVGELPAFDPRESDRGFFRIVDYDGDGLLDIVTPLGGPDSKVLRVYLGLGDGTFSLELDVELGIGIEWVELADLDGDATLDAVVARSDLPELVVFRGRDADGLETPVTVPLETGPRDLVIADVNQDGTADSVLMSSSALSVVHADGAGGFGLPNLTAFGGRDFESMIAADFGAKGGTEVALTDRDRNEVVIVAFEPGGALETVAHRVEESPIALSAGDHDRDGLTDLAVVYQHHPELSILLGPGVSGRVPREVRIPLSEDGPRAIVTGDVDGDGAADLLLATREGVSIHHGDGAGAFPRRTSRDVASSARWLELVDVDGDDALDLIAAKPDSRCPRRVRSGVLVIAADLA